MGTSIILNGQKISLQDSITIHQLLNEHDIDPHHVVVEVNQSIISRDQFDACSIRNGDTVEILRFVGGG